MNLSIPQGNYPLAVKQQAENVLNGRPVDQFAANVRRHQLFHRKTESGVTAGAQKTFFNVAEQQDVTNLPTSGGLSSESIFIMQALRFDVELGFNAAGGQAADGAPYDADGVNAVSMADRIARILQSGEVKADINGRQIVNAYGLHSFPPGKGVRIADSVLTSAAASESVAGVQNGSPVNGNAWLFSPMQVLLPQQTLNVTTRWAFSLSTIDEFVLRAEIEGILITPRQF
ncbi:MAG: hypothetical protein AAGJ54_05815 [Planctomycetota bacterium]